MKQNGFTYHLILPLVMIGMIAAIGGYVLTKSKAASINEDTSVLSAAPSPPTRYRAMWVWEDTVLETAASQKSLLDFAHSQKVNVVYLDAESAIQQTSPAQPNVTELAEFVGLAKSTYHIQTEFLYAEPGWVATPAPAISLVSKTLAYMTNVTAAQRPAGVTFDEEPPLTPTTEAQLLSLYSQLRTAAQGKLRVGATYQFIYDSTNYTYGGVTKPMTEWVIDKLDEPVLMDYRNDTPLIKGDSIASHAILSVAYAASINKKVYLGLETNNFQPSKITFYGLGKTALETAMKNVKTAFQSSPALGGWVIEDYDGYKALGP